MKILELTNFTVGGCGVGARVLEESKRLSKNHNVMIFSSNHVKGSNEIAKREEVIAKIKIIRFPVVKLGGESFMFWLNKEAEKEALKFKPDIIIAHSYRHIHTIKALKLKNKLKSRVFLVTHAPFIEKNITRDFLSKLSVNFYDKLIAPSTLNKFDKIIAITKWEIPYLLRLGIKKEKIAYIPNGIPKEFFNQKKSKEEKKILFLGRIAPIKNLETLIKAIGLIKDKKIKLEIVGPAEEQYLVKLKFLINKLNLAARVLISKPIYDIKEKAKKIDSAKIFVLPSKTEAMPQSLIEAMAREKIVIASNNRGTKEIIQDGKNGYLFDVGNERELAQKIEKVLALKKSEINKIKKQAKKSVEQFSWDKVIKKLEKLMK